MNQSVRYARKRSARSLATLESTSRCSSESTPVSRMASSRSLCCICNLPMNSVSSSRRRCTGTASSNPCVATNTTATCSSTGTGAYWPLLQNLDKAFPAKQLALGGRIQVGPEFGEGLQFAVLREVDAQRACDLFHRLDLRVAAYAGYGNPDVDGRAHPRIEEVRFQIYLAVRDGNHIRRDVGGNVSGLRFDDGQGGQRTASFHLPLQRFGDIVHLDRDRLRFVDLGGPFQQAAVQVKHVARIRLAPRRAAQQQRHFPIGDRLLGKVVVDHKGMPARIPEILPDAGPGIRGDELQRSRRRSGRIHDDRVVHGVVFFERSHHMGHGGRLLPAGHVHAKNRLVGVLGRFLIDNRVDQYGGLAGLPVPDDEFPLPPPDRDHRVDGLDAGLERLVHRLSVDNARGLPFQRHFEGFARNGAASVYRVAQRIDHAPQHAFGDVDRRDAPGPARFVTLPDRIDIAEQYDSDVVFLEIEHHAGGSARRKRDQLPGLYIRKSVKPRDAVPCLQDGPDFVDIGSRFQIAERALQNRGNFIWSN